MEGPHTSAGRPLRVLVIEDGYDPDSLLTAVQAFEKSARPGKTSGAGTGSALDAK